MGNSQQLAREILVLDGKDISGDRKLELWQFRIIPSPFLTAFRSALDGTNPSLHHLWSAVRDLLWSPWFIAVLDEIVENSRIILRLESSLPCLLRYRSN